MTVVAFEGIDRAGKSTLMRAVKNRLKKLGYSVTMIQTVEGHYIDGYVEGIRANCKVSTHMDKLLYAVQRESRYDEYMAAKKRYDYVLMDRSPLSSNAYGGLIIPNDKYFRNLYNTEMVRFHIDQYVFLTINSVTYRKRSAKEFGARADSRIGFLMLSLVQALYTDLLLRESNVLTLSGETQIHKNVNSVVAQLNENKT